MPSDGLADTISRLRRAMRRAARASDPGNELSVAQLELLSNVAENPGIRPGQLARLLHLRPNSVTTLVNGLSTQGMISRGATGTDRRTVTLHLTDEGHRAVASWQTTNATVLRTALAALTAAQRRTLAAAVPALDALSRAVDQVADTQNSPGSRTR